MTFRHCGACRHFLGGREDIIISGTWVSTVFQRCGVGEKKRDIVRGEIFIPSDALIKNKKLDCPDFEQTPWWRFW